jgi:hypothetical protein
VGIVDDSRRDLDWCFALYDHGPVTVRISRGARMANRPIHSSKVNPFQGVLEGDIIVAFSASGGPTVIGTHLSLQKQQLLSVLLYRNAASAFTGRHR